MKTVCAFCGFPRFVCDHMPDVIPFFFFVERPCFLHARLLASQCRCPMDFVSFRSPCICPTFNDNLSLAVSLSQCPSWLSTGYTIEEHRNDIATDRICSSLLQFLRLSVATHHFVCFISKGKMSEVTRRYSILKKFQGHRIIKYSEAIRL